MRRGLALVSDEATIALAGIFADTGNFTHESVTAEDFLAASFLMEQRASLAMVSRILKPLKEEHQMSLFHQILNEMVYQDIHGNLVALSYVVMDRQAGGLAAVVEKVFDVEDVDALFTVFSFAEEKSALIIARSRHDRIAVNELMKCFGGGATRGPRPRSSRAGPAARCSASSWRISTPRSFRRRWPPRS